MSERLPANVKRAQDPGGRALLRLEHEQDAAEVSLCGAQVLRWQHAGGEVLWTASQPKYAAGQPVRGGVPLVFPWFGDHATDPKLPAHGFARNRTWTLVHANDTPEVVLELTDDEATRAMWPHSFRLRLSVVLGAKLRLGLTVENTGGEPFAFEAALHSYFVVGDVRTASVHGLEGLPCTEQAAEPEAQWDRAQPLRFRAETDRIFQGVPERLELRSPALARTVTLLARDARSAIVWNPWPAKTAKLSQMAPDDWQRFCCVETANVREHAVRLGAGEAHRLALAIACEPA
ncbi:MAG: D-hexose-6-phosphate mutarotase [Planctomycetes bacterium]|nr:D-hexose-6-phosphate mutarotase [Planctomycetota bacterium]